jgi:carboxyl-terminal processing protease
VVETRDPNGAIEVGADHDAAVLWDGPLVLLTSRFSASASEILAGALQDYGRAVLVGDSSTFGKGTVQSVLPLASIMDQNGLPHAYDPGALKVTIRKFYRPSGASTQLRGVASDIVLPSASDLSEISESSLKDPLPWDTIAAPRFEPVNQVKPYLATLREKSARRVAADKAFALLVEDVARLKKTVGSRSVSLNEAQRRQELEQAKAREQARERDSKLRAPGPTSYEITVKAAGEPGLPPPGKKADPPARKAAPGEGSGPDGTPHAGSAVDLIFEEGVAILRDYIDLLSSKSPTAEPTPR